MHIVLGKEEVNEDLACLLAVLVRCKHQWSVSVLPVKHLGDVVLAPLDLQGALEPTIVLLLDIFEDVFKVAFAFLIVGVQRVHRHRRPSREPLPPTLKASHAWLRVRALV